MSKQPTNKNTKAPAAAPKAPITANEDPATQRNRIVRQLTVLLAIVAFAVYANTLSNGYVYDDMLVIKQNTLVTQGIAAIPEIFTTPRLHGFAHVNNDSYRPLSLAMFAAEYQLGGGSPGTSHFFNILFFAGGVVLLFRFLAKLMGGQNVTAAFVAAALYAVHPIHTEVVANIKSRDELMCFFFAFLAMNMLVKYMGSAQMKHLAMGLGALLLSFLSKETVITFLAIIPLTFFLYINENRKRAIMITAGSVAVAGLFLLLWNGVLNAHHANELAKIDFSDNILIKAPDVATRLATSMWVNGAYLKLLFVPYPLVCDYSFRSIPMVGFGNPMAIVATVAYVAMAATGVYRLIKYKKDLWAFGLLFFLATISLFTNIAFLFSSIMGERFLFFASAGFCMLAGLAVSKILPAGTDAAGSVLKNRKLQMALVPVLLIYSVMTIARNAEWADNMTLYTADIQKLPDNTRLNYNLGNEYLTMSFDQMNANRQEDYKQSIKYFKKALEVNPKYQNVLLALGLAYYNFNNPDSAKYAFEEAIRVKPDYSMAMFYLANIYINRNDYPTAIDLLKKAVKYEPEYLMAIYNLGACYQSTQKLDSAIVQFRRVTELQPAFNNYKAYELMATDYATLGMADSARKYEGYARQNNPSFKVGR